MIREQCCGILSDSSNGAATTHVALVHSIKVRTYVRVYIRMYFNDTAATYIALGRSIKVRTYVRTYVCMKVRTYVCVYVCMYVNGRPEHLILWGALSRYTHCNTHCNAHYSPHCNTHCNTNCNTHTPRWGSSSDMYVFIYVRMSGWCAL